MAPPTITALSSEKAFVSARDRARPAPYRLHQQPKPRKAEVMEIGRHLVLSTAHIRCATAQLLNCWASLPLAQQPLAVAPTSCGWFLSTCADQTPCGTLWPAEIPPVLAYARAQGCSYILLDCDGPEDPALPRFAW
jgi:hypothetical protein